MKRKFFQNAFLSIVMAAFLSTAFIANAQDLSAPLPIDSKVVKGTLPNGLTYYIRPNSKPQNKVELRLVVNAGSILEDDSQQGLAHFMEHMNFNGLEHFKKNELVSYLQSIGVEFGADLNAYTSFDQTVYILPIPTDKPGNLEKGFQIIEDWAHNALLTGEDIDGERNVVLEESRRGKGADDRMRKQYLPKLLAGSRYAERLPIGKDDILKNFKYDEVRRFYHDWYRPDLQAVVVVGDITADEAKKLIEQHFAGIKNPANEKERFYADVKPYTAPHAQVVTDKEATSYDFSIFFSARKEVKEKTLGDYRNNMVRNLFIQMLNKRLTDMSQSANPPFVNAYAYVSSVMARGYESFLMGVTPGNDINKSINAGIAELLRAQQFGFTKNELELAKKSVMSNVENVYNERNTTESARLINEYIDNYLTGEPIPGIENEYKYYQEMLPSITLEEVTQEANKWIAPEQTKSYYALLTGPDKGDAKLPNDAGLSSTVQAAFQQKVTPYEEKKVADKLLEKDPVPGKIVKEEKNENLGTVTYTLSNGVLVTVKKTDFKSDEILLQATKKGGTGNYGGGDNANTHFMSDVIESMGYGNFTPTELTDVLSGKTVGLTSSMGAFSDNLDGNSSVKDLPTLMELTYLQLTSPRKDEALYNAFAGKMKTQLMFLKSNPQVSFIDTLIKTLYHNDPRRPIAVPTEADFNNINVDRVLDIYKNEFSNADGFHFFLVGNVDEATLKPLLEKYIASLPSKGTTPDFKDNGLRPITGNKTLEYKKGSEPKSLVLGIYNGEMPYSEEDALKTDMLAQIITIKSIEEIREKMGAVYSGGFNGQFIQYPYAHYTIQMQMPCGPENVQAILKAAQGEIDAIKKDGPEAQDLEKVKATILEKRRENLKKNDYWIAKLQQIMMWGASQDRFLSGDDQVNKVSAADIKAIANKEFNGNNAFIAILNPETTAPAKAAEDKK